MKQIITNYQTTGVRWFCAGHHFLLWLIICWGCPLIFLLSGCQANQEELIQRSLIEAETAIHSARLVGADSAAVKDIQQAEDYYQQAVGDLQEKKAAESLRSGANESGEEPVSAAEKALQAKTKAENAMKNVKRQHEELKASHRLLQEKLESIRHTISSIQDQPKSMNTQGEIIITPEIIYRSAYQQFTDKNYPAAKTGFQTFVTLFPHHALSSNALYWIGECYYSVRDYQSALDIFLDVPQQYPAGNKVPDALLKAGYCYRNLQQSDQAAIYFKLVIKDYPQTAAARLAQQQLSRRNP